MINDLIHDESSRSEIGVKAIKKHTELPAVFDLWSELKDQPKSCAILLVLIGVAIGVLMYWR
jgi:hypothetical protein